MAVNERSEGRGSLRFDRIRPDNTPKVRLLKIRTPHNNGSGCLLPAAVTLVVAARSHHMSCADL